MQRIEFRPVSVTYCDVCGKPIVGNGTIRTFPDGRQLHAHSDWDEQLQGRCCDRLDAVTVSAAPSFALAEDALENLLQRVRELAAWQRTVTLEGEALLAYAQAHWGDRHDGLQLAEGETTRQALQYLANEFSAQRHTRLVLGDELAQALAAERERLCAAIKATAIKAAADDKASENDYISVIRGTWNPGS